MLACQPRRQHHHNFQPSGLHSPATSVFSDSNNYLPQTSSAYHNSIPSYATTHSTSNSSPSGQYMTTSFGISSTGPSIRVQQSSPLPQSTASYAQQPALADNLAYSQNNWSGYQRNGQMIASQPLQAGVHQRRAHSHQRAPSVSSMSSSNPTSPFGQSNPSSLQYNYSAENSPSTKVESSYHGDTSRHYSNHLPTPSQTPTQESFMNSTANNYYNPQQPHNFESALAAHMALNSGIDQNSAVTDDMPDISHSSRHSVSSYGQEPATPHDIYDEVKGYTNDSLRQNVPKFERTMTDAYADIGYDPTTTAIPQSMPQKQPGSAGAFLSPFRSVMNERLQQAQNARSQSPASSLSGGISPFRQGSPLAPTSGAFGSPRAKLGTAAQVREQQKAETDNARALRQNMAQEQEAPKTISPKDVELEYHESEEDSKMPLFSENASEYDQQYAGGNTGYNATPIKYESGYSNLPASRADNNWNLQQQNQAPYPATSAAPQSNFTFQPPALPASVHGPPFNSQNYRTASAMPHQQPDETPEFPAHLTSMESSASEAAPPSSNNSQHTNTGDVQKPASALADTGTYTCTYHGCTQRFETPQKLQRHKREAHRQVVTTPGVGSGMSSAALQARNSQAGPHKCERINPTTGKPCNTIFSRPYDLTRHEDTIHNVRKQKVRCALCVEDKTFSRNDALTRHMRVVHPDVDFPGKHRRRGS